MPKAARRVHCGCTILPPYLLRRIAAHGTQAQREAALDTLAMIAGYRGQNEQAQALSEREGLEAAGVEVHLDTDGTHLLQASPPPATVVKSPGVPGGAPVVAAARAAGLEVEVLEDLTDHVFRPFGDWLARYRAALDPDVARRIDWTKYRATAAFLRWADEQRVLRYVSCVGVRAGSAFPGPGTGRSPSRR